jgi:hypothetical protein
LPRAAMMLHKNRSHALALLHASTDSKSRFTATTMGVNRIWNPCRGPSERITSAIIRRVVAEYEFGRDRANAQRWPIKPSLSQSFFEVEDLARSITKLGARRPNWRGSSGMRPPTSVGGTRAAHAGGYDLICGDQLWNGRLTTTGGNELLRIDKDELR